ncbi:MAG: tetratricopeptide repeat protein, partial [Thermoanaerobaculia bacterium]
ESRHATGVAYLLIDRKNDSITALEQAANGSNDPHTWSDLAAARYAVATQDERPSQLQLALADADHALRLDPKSPEALFNRALILEHLGVRDQARKAWEAYLAVDNGSDWGVEARAHLRALEKTSRRFDPKLLETEPADRLVREFPEDARRNGEVTMLAAWANAEAAGDHVNATAILARVHAIADALAARSQERLLADAVAAIESSSGDRRAALISGHRIYYDARIDQSNHRFSNAEPQLHRAADLFSRGGSPMALVSAYYEAQAVSGQNRGELAHQELQSLLSKIDTNRHRALGAEIHWELAVCANGAGDWGTGAREAAVASAIFRNLGELENSASTDAVAAAALDLMGEKDAAWNHRISYVAQAGASGDRQKLGAVLRNAASTLASTGQTAAASAIINLAVEEDRSGDAAQLSQAEADAARFAALNGDLDHARQSLGNARAASSAVSDAALRERVKGRIDLADATALAAAGDTQAAIASLDRSIDFFTSHQANVEVAQAYLLRARAERTLGNTALALAGLTSALHEVEKQRATIHDAASQLSFLDVAGQIIEETIDLRLAQGDVRGAFD